MSLRAELLCLLRRPHERTRVRTNDQIVHGFARLCRVDRHVDVVRIARDRVVVEPEAVREAARDHDGARAEQVVRDAIEWSVNQVTTILGGGNGPVV